MSTDHPIFGAIPPIYDPGLDASVVACAERIALDFLRRDDARTAAGEVGYGFLRGSTETRGVPFLYRLVRDSMGRVPVAPKPDVARYGLDDESISQGIVQALNAPREVCAGGEIVTTDYAAISYGSTPENSRYVKRSGEIVGAVCRAHDGTWIAYSAEQILDMRDSLARDLPDMASAVTAIVGSLS